MSRRKAFGSALDLTQADDRLKDRFWSKVDIAGPDDCWPWVAHRKASGYGQFVLRKGVFITASRASLAMVAPLSDGDVACHRCDNPPCVNPAHLFVGTQATNALDCITKGRGRRSNGESHPHARLTAIDVTFIRTQDLTIRGRATELGQRFGVSANTIRRAATGQTWAGVA